MPKSKPLPSTGELRSAFNYDPETGVFRRTKDGSVCGSPSGTRYLQLTYKNRRLLCHRVAWLFITGEDPGDKQVEHRNRDRQDNSASNLRLADSAQNAWNTTARGYYYNKSAYGYQVSIKHRGTAIYIGLYRTPEEARAAYIDAVKEARGDYVPAEYSCRKT